MSLVSALSKLLIKMGGSPAAGDNSDELVNKIADQYNNGGNAAVDVTFYYDDERFVYCYDANITAKELYDLSKSGPVQLVITDMTWVGDEQYIWTSILIFASCDESSSEYHFRFYYDDSSNIDLSAIGDDEHPHYEYAE